MWTLPAARRRGLARAVLDAAIGFLRQEDDATVSGGEGSSVQEWLVSVGVHEDNMAARSLYEKCGFTVVPSSVSPARDEEASVGRDRVAASLTSKPIRMELRLASAA